MENSKGGYIIIDISSLLLDETEQATDIEDEVILKQLLSLSDYAFRSDLHLKPIYLRAKDKNGINIVSMCEFDKNGTQLQIKALISDLVVEILVNYEVEEETQAILIDYATYSVISETNKIKQQLLLENIKDSSGNLRFIEGDINIEEIEGVTQAYGKWSLSGTHLMVVLAVDIANGVQLVNNSVLAYFSLPSYIFNKIVPLWSTTVTIKNILAYAEDFNVQSFTIVLNKDSEQMRIRTGVNPLTTSLKHLRIEFDLLIDTNN